MKHRDLLVAVIFVATALASGAARATTYRLTCANSIGDNLQGALNGTSSWTTPGSADAVKAGDLVELHGFCLGDVVVTTAAAAPLSGFTIGNRFGSARYSDSADGINGQIAIKNAELTLQGIYLESGQGSDTMTSGEFADVYARDSASVILSGDFVGPGPLIGVYVMHGSSAQILGSFISGNGTANTANENDGIRVEASSSVILGEPGVGVGGDVENNVGNGITVLAGSSFEGYTTTFVDNGDCATQCGSEVYLSGASTALLTQVSQFNSPSTSTAQPPLIEVLGASSLTITGTTSVEGTTAEQASSSALLVASASSAVLNSALIAATGAIAGKPVVEASDSSSIVLAGNNTICAGSYSNPTCTASTGGTAIQIDHSSSLQQQQAVALGYSPDAPETITGAGVVQVQSSIDLGQGTASALTWTVPLGGNILVQQNSSFRLSGGVTISTGGGGSVRIQQGSNGFFNTANGGTNSATIICINTANNPAAHVSGPGSVSPAITANSLNNLLTGVSGATNPGEANACLNF